MPGFSLIEMLIVVTLFSLVVVILAQTFSSFNQLHRKLANRAIVNQDLRFAMELLVRASRNRPISYVTPPQERESELRLSMSDGEEMIVRRSELGQAECGDVPTVSCLLLSTDSGATWAPISGKRINIERFDVYVRPLQSPFDLDGGSYPNDIQPFVTFNMRMRYMAENPKEQQSLESQTTVSSRVYQR